MTLTGKIRHRVERRRFGRNLLVLQVEETGWHCIDYMDSGRETTSWRDAQVEDLPQLYERGLLK